MSTKILEELGFTPAEISIYLALLDLGESTTGPLIDHTGLQSSTIYHVIGGLIEKGLINFIYRGKVKYYSPESPEKLIVYLQEKEKKLNELIPELKKREKINSRKQTAKVFVGINGLISAFQDILDSLNPGEEYYFFQFPETKFENERIRLFLRNYHLKRAEKGIRVKGLAFQSDQNKYPQLQDLPYTEIRFIKEFLPAGIVVYKDKVLTLEWDNNPIIFVIQSNTVADSYRKFFEQKWNQTKQ